MRALLFLYLLVRMLSTAAFAEGSWGPERLLETRSGETVVATTWLGEPFFGPAPAKFVILSEDDEVLAMSPLAWDRPLVTCPGGRLERCLFYRSTEPGAPPQSALFRPPLNPVPQLWEGEPLTRESLGPYAPEFRFRDVVLGFEEEPLSGWAVVRAELIWIGRDPLRYVGALVLVAVGLLGAVPPRSIAQGLKTWVRVSLAALRLGLTGLVGLVVFVGALFAGEFYHSDLRIALVWGPAVIFMLWVRLRADWLQVP